MFTSLCRWNRWARLLGVIAILPSLTQWCTPKLDSTESLHKSKPYSILLSQKNNMYRDGLQSCKTGCQEILLHCHFILNQELHTLFKMNQYMYQQNITDNKVFSAWKAKTEQNPRCQISFYCLLVQFEPFCKQLKRVYCMWEWEPTHGRLLRAGQHRQGAISWLQ